MSSCKYVQDHDPAARQITCEQKRLINPRVLSVEEVALTAN